jgi:prepilin-type N-terminal cleavage/methylation domain-containing protein
VKKKLSSGFTLIEVIVALVILGLSVGTIFRFQGQLIRGTLNAHNLIERLPIIKNMFVQAAQEKWYDQDEPKTKKDDALSMTLVYSIKKVPETSALKAIENVRIEKVDAEWPGLLVPKKESLMTFRCVIRAAS